MPVSVLAFVVVVVVVFFGGESSVGCTDLMSLYFKFVGAPGAVNTHYFVRKLLSAIYKFSFIHDIVDRPLPCLGFWKDRDEQQHLFLKKGIKTTILQKKLKKYNMAG